MNRILPSLLSGPLSRGLGLLLVLIGCLTGPDARGQNQVGWCGTPSPSIESKRAFVEMIKRVEKQRGMAKVATTDANGITWIALQPWIMRANDKDANSREDVNSYLKLANQHFKAAKIQFYYKSLRYIVDQTPNLELFNLRTCDMSSGRLTGDPTKSVRDAINVYFSGQNLACFCNDDRNETPCASSTVSYTRVIGGVAPSLNDLQRLPTLPTTNPFTDYRKNAIYLAIKLGNKDDQSMSHELGHYFGLFHTHEGNGYCDELVDVAGKPLNTSTDKGDLIEDTNVDISQEIIRPRTTSAGSNTFTISYLYANCPSSADYTSQIQV